MAYLKTKPKASSKCKSSFKMNWNQEFGPELASFGRHVSWHWLQEQIIKDNSCCFVIQRNSFIGMLISLNK